MLKKQVFIGDICKCTRYHIFEVYRNGNQDSVQCVLSKTKIYKKNAVLLQFGEMHYFDLDRIKSISKRPLLSNPFQKNYLNSFWMMPTKFTYPCMYFVDSSSLKPYYQEDEWQETITILQLKKQLKSRF